MLFLKKLHKWLSLLVGLQLLVWLGTGLYFNLMDHQKASGNQYKQTPVVALVDINRLVEPQLVLSQAKQVVSLKQISLLEHPYYLLTHNKGLYSHFKNDYSLVDAYTAEPVVIDETMARKLAQSSYKGQGIIESAIKLSPPYEDIPREQNEVWQVNYADYIQTSVYIDAGSGRIIKHINDDKRFVDIFFMLHFMDYGTEGSFNNVQIIVFSLFMLFFSLTGFIWTIELLFNGQYKIRFGRKNRTLALFDKDLEPIGEFDLATNTNLLDGLIDHDIALSSTCGGGGTCGQCKVRLDSRVKVTSAEHVLLTKEQLQQGYRLACQHDATETKRLTLIDVTKAKKYLLELTHSEFISPYIKELRFKVLGGNKLTYKAGAHMRFFIPAAKGVSIPQCLPENLKYHWRDIEYLEYEHQACSRSYSLANGDGQIETGTNELKFTVKIQNAPNKSIYPGVGSSYICNLGLGQTIEAVGPFEHFHAKPSSEKTMILIGAGSGMAPLKSLIEEQLNMIRTRNKYNRKIYFFYGARTENDLLYQDKFFELSGGNPNFHYYPVLSRPSKYWTETKGYVQDLLATNISDICKIDSVEFYVCGPPEMMKTTIELLKENNVDASDIAFDRFT
jgi:Na(+)-translocating NADH:ubiquinone oxidoreductase F subunit